ncbi:unnamed protein product [Rotaria socialis]|uniref:Uncharacterized protein n=2 Tax=Rotaria socialis TaxID=392032 RepID=A0A820IRJ3_9BILA|nr:unnamed protein product [Rotaria socialis]CAF3421516.1 unnamed protein product [Rotaria socialis]CAF3556240.1 unnamed protein product [Rotaria socialis]CAF4315772.1 unnamed protein product [Rotaria socialis]CAF4316027.1 unnamed protein product [Rotaria socialis]
MYCHQLLLIVSIAVFSNDYSLLVAADPAIPIWPVAFQETFTETSTLPIVGTGTNIQGTYYYDFDQKAVRIDRSTGKYDRYCSSVKLLQDVPCTHLVVNGLRYLVFPSLKSCCMCCTSESGCGVLSPNWLSNATFVGYNTTSTEKYQVWNKKGLQNNFYWQVDSTQVPYIIDQEPNDLMVYDVTSFKKGAIDPSVFALPSYCSKDQKCPFLSVCTVAR